ncbi:hypothetical protein NPIL_199471 [Nephila pilipes]|uniref:Uncharacterized protein n=1 Tax=Nephila pilipes TaxID=299642 RepID=A0A8X6MXS4_NEPPI|nr:hypothetical protein NPIL_199471 [Nephila pilipes]
MLRLLPSSSSTCNRSCLSPLVGLAISFVTSLHSLRKSWTIVTMTTGRRRSSFNRVLNLFSFAPPRWTLAPLPLSKRAREYYRLLIRPCNWIRENSR